MFSIPVKSILNAVPNSNKELIFPFIFIVPLVGVQNPVYTSLINFLETEIKKEEEIVATITISSIPYQEKKLINRIEITTYPKEDSYLETDQEIDKKQQELVAEIKQEFLQKTISINPIFTRKNPIEETDQAIYSVDFIDTKNEVQELLNYYQQQGILIEKEKLIEGEKSYGK